MGVREWLAVAVVGLFLYVAYQIVRALRAEREPAPATTVDTVVDDVDPDSADDEDDELYVFERPASPPSPATVAPAPTTAQSSAATANIFQLQLEVQQLRRDVVQLQTALRAQRAEFDTLAEAVRTRVAERDAEANLAGRGVSPEYNEALVCARRGLSVDEIAEHCGITVAEAELVHTLANGRGGASGGSAA